MDIWTLLRTFLRRWYVTLPIVMVGAAGGYVLAQEQEPTYHAQSSAILTPPQIVEDPRAPEGITEVNPLLHLGGSLTTTTQVLVVRMDSLATRIRYEQNGLIPDYEVDEFNAVLFFDVEGDDPDRVVATARRLVELADIEVAGMQEWVDGGPEERIRAIAVSLPDEALEDDTPAKIVLAVAVALGLLVALTTAVALDGFLRWRKRALDESPGSASGVSPATATPISGKAGTHDEELTAAKTATRGVRGARIRTPRKPAGADDEQKRHVGAPESGGAGQEADGEDTGSAPDDEATHDPAHQRVADEHGPESDGPRGEVAPPIPRSGGDGDDTNLIRVAPGGRLGQRIWMP